MKALYPNNLKNGNSGLAKALGSVFSRYLSPFQILILISFFGISSVYAAEKTAYLQYQPNLPVHLTSTLTLDLSQSLPGLSLSTKGKQILEADLTLSQEKEGLPVLQPPFNVAFLLKGICLDMEANGERFSFNSTEREGSVYSNQLSELMNHPIVLQFGAGFVLNHQNESLKKMMRGLPLLQEIPLEGFLEELLSPLFAGAGRQLVIGQVIERELFPNNFSSGLGINHGDTPSLPRKVVYTITDIDDYHVFGALRGEIKKHFFELKGKMFSEEKDTVPITASLSGVVEGSVKWNRDNALLHSLQLEYSYVARFQWAEWEWLMHVSLKLENLTKLSPNSFSNCVGIK